MHENFCVAGTFSAREVRKPNRKTNCSLMALQVSHLLCLSRLRVFRERAREKKRALACSRRSETAQRRQRLHGNFLFLRDRIGSEGRQFSREALASPVRLFHLFRSVAAPFFLLLFFRGRICTRMYACKQTGKTCFRSLETARTGYKRFRRPTENTSSLRPTSRRPGAVTISVGKRRKGDTLSSQQPDGVDPARHSNFHVYDSAREWLVDRGMHNYQHVPSQFIPARLQLRSTEGPTELSQLLRILY